MSLKFTSAKFDQQQTYLKQMVSNICLEFILAALLIDSAKHGSVVHLSEKLIHVGKHW